DRSRVRRVRGHSALTTQGIEVFERAPSTLSGRRSRASRFLCSTQGRLGLAEARTAYAADDETPLPRRRERDLVDDLDVDPQVVCSVATERGDDRVRQSGLGRARGNDLDDDSFEVALDDLKAVDLAEVLEDAREEVDDEPI